ncbi:hypothetical protein [Marinitoga lauensis]|uniref:hypothetical protein n=1 Tax=Marinitoga lauensis TaxID=2201189 RepID=UPI001011AE9F|nr:hypothetical protein [Marinitoga lauensis]
MESIKKIPKRYIYFFSEVKNEFDYINDIGNLYIIRAKREKEKIKSFMDFYPDNDLIYSILKITKKSLIPFTIWDLINFYKKGYRIRYLEQNNEIISLYILKNNVVEFTFFDVENINLMIQMLNDISNFVDDEFIIIIYSNQKILKIYY